MAMRFLLTCSLPANSSSSYGHLNRRSASKTTFSRAYSTLQNYAAIILLASSVGSACAQSAQAASEKVHSQLNATFVPHPALLDCQKRFRLAEISAQIPHQAQTMVEFCSSIKTACVNSGERTADCDKAISRLDRLLVSTMGSLDRSSTSRN
jgi:hypothetical protein